MSSKTLVLIDATAFCYRAFYALRGLSTSSGQPTNAIYGFLVMLRKVLKEKKPDYLAVCFDVSRDTFRKKKFAAYKIQRPPMPDGLSSQIPLIKEILAAYRIRVFEKQGFEADDIIATLTKKATAQGMRVTIVSSDKDMLQLVDKETVVFSPYKDEGITYDEKAVVEHFGVPPQRISDIIALMGDDVDNIPGIPGIGEKTAVELVREFGTLDNLLHHRREIAKEKIKQSIEDNLDTIALNKELAVLDSNVDCALDAEQLKMQEPDTAELFRLFKQMEFKSLLRELPATQEVHATDVKAKTILDAQLKDFLHTAREVVLCPQGVDEMVLWIDGMFFLLKDPGTNLKTLCADAQVKKIGHDLKKTKRDLAGGGIILEGLYFDTMIAAYLLNPAKPGYTISDICLEYLEEDHVRHISDALAAAQAIVAVRPRLASELKEKSLDKLFVEIEMPLISVLADMESAGISLDLAVLKSLSHDIEKRLAKLIEEIYGLSGTQFNLNSPKQLRQILFEHLALPVVRRGKTGPSTDEEVLRTLASKHALPKLLLEYRQLTKLKNTYSDVLPTLINPRTHKVHTSFNQTTTETGRLSSTQPNLQNIPVKTDIGKKIRQAIVASSSAHCLLSCDYSQVELRILAHLSGDEHLSDAFEHERDIHKATAALIYGVEEKDVTDAMREAAKRINFGIVYGLSAYGLSRDLEIPVSEAEAFIDAYFLRYPKVKDYIEQQIAKAHECGFVTTMLGRRRYLPEINNKNQTMRQMAERQAINTPIQGSASDLIKLAMIEIHRLFKEKDLRSAMILQVHDELVFDVPREEEKEVVAMVRGRMEHGMSLTVPLRVDVKKGANWLEMEPAE